VEELACASSLLSWLDLFSREKEASISQGDPAVSASHTTISSGVDYYELIVQML
jgi:hypothetical protein